MICLNMVQQPPRLEVASGPFKHLGQGMQLRLWLWIAVPRVAFSDPKVTHSDPTHLPLPPPTSPAMHLAISHTNETSGWVEGGNQL